MGQRPHGVDENDGNKPFNITGSDCYLSTDLCRSCAQKELRDVGPQGARTLAALEEQHAAFIART